MLFGLQSEEAKIWKMPDLRLPESLTQVPFVTALMIKLQWRDHLLHTCCLTPSAPANGNLLKSKIKTSLNLAFPAFVSQCLTS